MNKISTEEALKGKRERCYHYKWSVKKSGGTIISYCHECGQIGMIKEVVEYGEERDYY